jgi:hypothetical protein
LPALPSLGFGEPAKFQQFRLGQFQLQVKFPQPSDSAFLVANAENSLKTIRVR